MNNLRVHLNVFFIFTARILLPRLLKSNGRDKNNLTLSEDENNTFIAKVDQNNDA